MVNGHFKPLYYVFAVTAGTSAGADVAVSFTDTIAGVGLTDMPFRVEIPNVHCGNYVIQFSYSVVDVRTEQWSPGLPALRSHIRPIMLAAIAQGAMPCSRPRGTPTGPSPTWSASATAAASATAPTCARPDGMKSSCVRTCSCMADATASPAGVLPNCARTSLMSGLLEPRSPSPAATLVRVAARTSENR